MSVGPPTPAPDKVTAFFWEGCPAGKLFIQRCSNCGTYIHLPRPACKTCLGTNLGPDEVSGRGMLYSWTTAMQAFHPWFVGRIPYLIATISLPEQAGLRMVSNLVDCEEGDLRMDMPVGVVFREVAPDLVLPLFTPVVA